MEDRNKIVRSIVPVLLFVGVLWLIWICQTYIPVNLFFLGILPRTGVGIPGILTAPFIHANADHLLSNTLPLLIVGTGLLYFYREIWWRVLAMIWLFGNFWVWLVARPDSHIGASGLIYGMVCFLFFSGLFRKNKSLLAISLLVAFLYGSMVWGILPVSQTISWESHLFGSIAGIFAAIYFRREGPQLVTRVWDDEKEPTGPEYWMTEDQKKKFLPAPEDGETTIHYIYKEKNANQ